MFSKLIIEDGAKDEYVLCEPLLYASKKYGMFKVPVNTITDFATVPRIIHWLFRPHSRGYKKSSVLHDYLYSLRNFNRWKADLIFLEAMKHEQSLIIQGKHGFNKMLHSVRWFVTRWVFFGGVFIFGSLYKKGALRWISHKEW